MWCGCTFPVGAAALVVGRLVIRGVLLAQLDGPQVGGELDGGQTALVPGNPTRLHTRFRATSLAVLNLGQLLLSAGEDQKGRADDLSVWQIRNI